MKKKVQKLVITLIGLFTLYTLLSLIFQFSAQTGAYSDSLSDALYNFLKQVPFLNQVLYEWDQFVQKVLSALNLDVLYPLVFSTYSQWEVIIRKWAHFLLYFCLGGIGLTTFSYLFNFYKGYLITLYLGVSYAIIDEVHQLFVEGRSGQLEDIIIDVLGLFTALSIGMMFYVMLRCLTYVRLWGKRTMSTLNKKRSPNNKSC